MKQLKVCKYCGEKVVIDFDGKEKYEKTDGEIEVISILHECSDSDGYYNIEMTSNDIDYEGELNEFYDDDNDDRYNEKIKEIVERNKNMLINKWNKLMG